MSEAKAIADMNLKDVVGDYKTTTMTYFNGKSRRVHYTDIETPFPRGREKIISLSCPKGIITNANSTFVRMSGYSRDELMGSPHAILHHPDMPRKAFESMWSSLKNEGRWQGYVKNLRKDGGFYWVHASIFSMKRNGKLVGYTSSRDFADPEQVEKHTALYRDLMAQESY